MNRIKRGWGLTKKSWGLLNEHRELIRFPLYGALATIVPAIISLGPGLYLFDKNQLGGAIPLVVIGVYALSVVGFYSVGGEDQRPRPHDQPTWRHPGHGLIVTAPNFASL